ncbi:MAG: ABC transporter ATP-binding protein [Acidimicrobiia bacterium]|nr:ABC transporter ATP-binding protein [Acidimicrobiia bacterium]
MTRSDLPSENGGRHGGDVVLQVIDLRMYLHTRWGVTKAVDGVTFDLHAGETLGIVGESGCGKSMLALSLVRLTPEPASRFEGGQVLLDGDDLVALTDKKMRRIRGKKISMILQDPQQSLNPVFTIGNQLEEAIRIHGGADSKEETKQRAKAALQEVHVPEPERRLKNYPHEMSGGMKQRVVGAMAMVYKPTVLIADEPTTALDVTIQAQYLRLLRDLQRRTGVAMIVISHDFGVIAETCDRVAVMYAGKFVEQGPVADVFDNPSHPYTKGLLDSHPRYVGTARRLRSIEGAPPELTNLPPGCRFSPRCGLAGPECHESEPEPRQVSADHVTWCFKSEELPWASH